MMKMKKLGKFLSFYNVFMSTKVHTSSSDTALTNPVEKPVDSVENSILSIHFSYILLFLAHKWD